MQPGMSPAREHEPGDRARRPTRRHGRPHGHLVRPQEGGEPRRRLADERVPPRVVAQGIRQVLPGGDADARLLLGGGDGRAARELVSRRARTGFRKPSWIAAVGKRDCRGRTARSGRRSESRRAPPTPPAPAVRGRCARGARSAPRPCGTPTTFPSSTFCGSRLSAGYTATRTAGSGRCSSGTTSSSTGHHLGDVAESGDSVVAAVRDGVEQLGRAEHGSDVNLAARCLDERVTQFTAGSVAPWPRRSPARRRGRASPSAVGSRQEGPERLADRCTGGRRQQGENAGGEAAHGRGM